MCPLRTDFSRLAFAEMACIGRKSSIKRLSFMVHPFRRPYLRRASLSRQAGEKIFYESVVNPVSPCQCRIFCDSSII